MRESLSFDEATARDTPVVPDDAAAKPIETKQDATKPEAEKKAEQPKAPEVTDDPKSWPEPARRAHEAVAAKVAGYEAEIGKWREAGPKAVEQNRRLAEEVKLLRGLVEQHGLTVDPRDVELIRYRVGEQTSAQMVEAHQRRQQAAEEQQRQYAQQQAKQEAQNLVAEISRAAQAAGVPARDVGLLVHAQLGVDGKADIAGAVQDVKDRLTLRQQQVNAAAPSSVHSSIPTSNVQPHDRSRAGKEARLKRWGVTDF